jgi:hypothetical protein
MLKISLLLVVAFVFVGVWQGRCAAQAGQGAIQGAIPGAAIQVDGFTYRQAVWERQAVREPQDERPNRGGLLYVYLTNTSADPVRFRFFKINGEDSSYWLLSGKVAWDRLYHEELAPGSSTVWEINGVDEAFAPGKPFRFTTVDQSWKAASRTEGTLQPDPVAISLIRVLPGLDEIEVHVRQIGGGPSRVREALVDGATILSQEWVGQRLGGRDQAIGRLKLDKPLDTGELLVVRAVIEEGAGVRTVFGHRRVFEDWFPIGTWSSGPDTYDELKRAHIDLVVKGRDPDDPFFKGDAERHGLSAMVHSGKFEGMDAFRTLGDHPAVACWMPHDEPDWSTPAVVMAYSEAFHRQFSPKVPTMITLCRNAKFFEYAPIPDIPCQDHYCVAAPSSSEWPQPYGTRLEETAYYTRDLKLASEPKPVWVWTQGLGNWDGRPAMPLPTPDELAAQLMLNLGEGAKGILWFNYSKAAGERHPDTRQALRAWSRAVAALRQDLLGAEPMQRGAGAENLYVAPLASRDRVILCITNLAYQLHPEGYPFQERQGVTVTAALPEWVTPRSAVEVTPEGVKTVPCTVRDGTATVTLKNLRAATFVVLANDPDASETYARRIRAAWNAELGEQEQP